MKTNRSVGGSSHTHTHTRTLKPIEATSFRLVLLFAEVGRILKVGLGFIWILALCTYSLLFPLRISPLSSSPHLMLWMPVEKPLFLSPLGSVFLSLPLWPRMHLLHRRPGRKRFVPLARPLLLLLRSLTSIHSSPAACSLLSAPLERWTTPRERRGGGSREGWMWGVGRWSLTTRVIRGHKGQWMFSSRKSRFWITSEPVWLTLTLAWGGCVAMLSFFSRFLLHLHSRCWCVWLRSSAAPARGFQHLSSTVDSGQVL